MIRLGPAGLGGVKEAAGNLQQYHKLGLSACEIAFTYSIYIKPEQTKSISQAADKNKIKLSIHAPYWINLNSAEKNKAEDSKKRILECCRIAHLLKANLVVFHPGYYGKSSKEETFANIKKAIKEMQKEIKKNKWKVRLAPETTGRLNVFGSIEEILELVKQTRCFFTLDLAHIKAREQGKISYREIFTKFSSFKNLHCHFSGISYGKKGEKHHQTTPDSEIKQLSESLPKNKDITIINESPNPVKDSVTLLHALRQRRN